MQSFARLGREFRVNPNAAGDQRDPSVAITAYGGYQIFWTDSTADASVSGIKAQVFTATQSRFAADFLVNASTAQAQNDPNSVYLAGGGWNVTFWTDASSVGDSSGTGIKAQFMDGVGGKFQGEYLINTTTAGNQSDASAAWLGLNNHVVVWTDESSGTPAIRAQLMASRSKSGSELLVSAAGGPAATDAVVTPLPGGFVVVWRTGDASGSAVRAQIYTSAGAKVGGELILASGAADSIANPAVAALGGGRFVVAWQGVDGAGDAGIAARLFDSAGAPIGAEIAASGGLSGLQTHPSIAAVQGGGFLIGWTDGITGARDVRAQSFAADGTPLGGPLLVSEVGAGDQWGLSMATLTGGDTVLSWSETDGLGDTNVKAQLFRFASSAPSEGTPGGDALTGTADNDFIDGGAGDDTIRGGGGNDVLFGGEGQDRLYGEAGSDSLEGGIGDDILEDRTRGRDQLDGGDGNDTLFVVRSNTPTDRDQVTLFGGAGDDLIHYEGLGSDLTIEAGDGADTIELSAVEDVNATISLGAGQDLIKFLPPESGVFRTPNVRISDFETGAAGDRIDLSAIAGPDPFFTGEMLFRQIGADAVLYVSDDIGRYSVFATFENRLTRDFTSANFSGLRIPATLNVTADLESSASLVGEPAVAITGAGAHFVNLSGGTVKGSDAAAAAFGAIRIEAEGVVVDNRAGGLIAAANGGGTTAITGSGFADTILNSGVITGAVRLGAGNDVFSELATANNNYWSQYSLVDLGAGDDLAEYDMGGRPFLILEATGGEGSDTLAINGITGGAEATLVRTTGIETLRLSGAPGGSISFGHKPLFDDVFLATGITLVVPIRSASSRLYTLPAAGTLHLEGGNLTTWQQANFSQIIGTDAPERVDLVTSPPPATGTVAVGINSVAMGGGDDYFRWGAHQARPGAVDGGAGNDWLRVDQIVSSLSLATGFTGFETVEHYTPNLVGNAATLILNGLASGVQRLLLDPLTVNKTLELDLQAPGLAVGAGSWKLVIRSETVIGSLSDRYLIDPGQVASFAQNVENRGTIGGDVRLGAGADTLTNYGTIGGNVDLGDGVDVFDGLGGSVAGTVDAGPGNDFYRFDAFYRIAEAADGGRDEIRTSLASYSLIGTNVEVLMATTDDPHEFRGSAGDDYIGGAGANDVLLLQDGGSDQAQGGLGNDIFYFGAALDSGDTVDGNLGRDSVVLQGNVAVTLSPNNISGIESLSLQTGANANFGDTANNSYDYDVTMADGNVAAGVQLIVNGQSLRSDEDMTFDGSAELDGKYLVYAGHGVDLLTGGAGNDIFYFEGLRYGPNDKVDGGAGRDSVVIAGVSGLNHIEFAEDAFTGIESISVNNLLASDPSQKPSYELVLANGNAAAGQTLILNASSLTDPSQQVSFDGRAVIGGNLMLFGGASHDALLGGAGSDLLYGGRGADQLSGGMGADTFRYDAAAESAAGLNDTIGDFETGIDRIDLSRIDADSGTAGDQAFAFIGAAAFSGAAGQLRVFEAGGFQRIEGDTNGDMLADLVIVVNATGPLGQGDFLP